MFPGEVHQISGLFWRKAAAVNIARVKGDGVHL